jgi:anti-sigma factor (TIGR02949 family)
MHELLDDELPADGAEALRVHLAECPPCRARAAVLRRFVRALRRQRMRQPTAPAALRARVDAMLDALADASGAPPALAVVGRGLPERG